MHFEAVQMLSAGIQMPTAGIQIANAAMEMTNATSFYFTNDYLLIFGTLEPHPNPATNNFHSTVSDLCGGIFTNLVRPNYPKHL
jgi:hypothetical protein